MKSFAKASSGAATSNDAVAPARKLFIARLSRSGLARAQSSSLLGVPARPCGANARLAGRTAHRSASTTERILKGTILCIQSVAV